MLDIIELVQKEMFRRKYSERTICSYLFCLRQFFKYCHKEPRKITKKDIKDYLDNLQERNKTGSTINIHLNALKFAMEEILNKNFMVRIKYSKTPKTLPSVLSKDEVFKPIKSIHNEKHRLMTRLMYGAGLRVSELTNLKVKDLDFENNCGWVRHGKGNKDRVFILPDSLKEEIIKHIKEKNITFDSWLFGSYNGHISSRTLQVIIKKAAKEAKIKKNVHPHTLRHSYATHLIENGYDVASVQSLLGHNSAETTMIYLHIAKPKMINVKSPLDSLQLSNKDKKYGYEVEESKAIELIDDDDKRLRI